MSFLPAFKIPTTSWILRIFLAIMVVFLFWRIQLPLRSAFKINNLDFEPFLVPAYLNEIQLNALPSLGDLNWPTVQVASRPAGSRFPNGTTVPLPPVFTPIMSFAQRRVSERLLSTFSERMFTHGLGNRFMLYGGTLLGSFRHHDLIPWDDDIDVIVDIDVRETVRTILSQLSPNFTLFSGQSRDKFYMKMLYNSSTSDDVEGSRIISKYPWGWPYLDISYYSQNDTHIWDIVQSYGRSYVYSKASIFPLVFRPLGFDWYPTPFKLNRVLLDTYSQLDRCVMNGYSHVQEGSGVRGTIMCDKLKHQYAFVEHSGIKKNEEERMAWITECLVSAGNENTIVHQITLPWYLE